MHQKLMIFHTNNKYMSTKEDEVGGGTKTKQMRSLDVSSFFSSTFFSDEI